MSDYRLSILYRLQMLAYLDETPATANEKVKYLIMSSNAEELMLHEVLLVRHFFEPIKFRVTSRIRIWRLYEKGLFRQVIFHFFLWSLVLILS